MRATTGVTIASYTIWDSYAVTSLHVALVSYYAGTLLLQSLTLTPGALRQRQHIPAALRTNAVPILIVAIFSPLAYTLVLNAMLAAPLALVAPLRESSIIIGSLFEYLLFREAHLARRIVGARGRADRNRGDQSVMLLATLVRIYQLIQH